jgi:hypothetical protein
VITAEGGDMRRIALLITVSVLMSAPASLALADPPDPATQPDNGAVSSIRNPNGVAGGPHCHIVVVNQGQGHFDNVSAYPSHRAHIATGLPTGVFAGDGNCDGLP